MGSDFTHRMTEFVNANLHNEHFGPEELAAQMGISYSSLHRRVKEDLQKTISQFIRERRLEKAKYLLLNEQLSVSEVAYNVGFGSATYFNKCFHEQFGKSPGMVLLPTHIYQIIAGAEFFQVFADILRKSGRTAQIKRLIKIVDVFFEKFFID